MKKFAFWYFLCGWSGVIFLNKYIGAPHCWFYNDWRGEYAFSEIMTNLFYLASTILLFWMARRYAEKILYAPAAFIFWLLLEEANYGQIFLNKSETRYLYDEEQTAIHTEILRRIHFTWNMDMAEVTGVGILILITIGFPLALKHYFKISAKPYMLWLPCALTVFVFVGRYMDFLVPWECGYASFEEIYETLMASATVYFAYLLHLHLKETRSLNPSPQNSAG